MKGSLLFHLVSRGSKFFLLGGTVVYGMRMLGDAQRYALLEVFALLCVATATCRTMYQPTCATLLKWHSYGNTKLNVSL